jgi:hypothetical protein
MYAIQLCVYTYIFIISLRKLLENRTIKSSDGAGNLGFKFWNLLWFCEIFSDNRTHNFSSGRNYFWLFLYLYLYIYLYTYLNHTYWNYYKYWFEWPLLISGNYTFLYYILHRMLAMLLSGYSHFSCPLFNLK